MFVSQYLDFLQRAKDTKNNTRVIKEVLAFVIALLGSEKKATSPLGELPETHLIIIIYKSIGHGVVSTNLKNK